MMKMRFLAKVSLVMFVLLGTYHIMSNLDSGYRVDKARVHLPHARNVLNARPIPDLPSPPPPPPKEIIAPKKTRPKVVKTKIKKQEPSNNLKLLEDAYNTFLNKKDTTIKHVVEEEQPDVSVIKPRNKYPTLPRQSSISADAVTLEFLNSFVPPGLPPISYSTEKPIFQYKKGKNHVIFCATSGSTGTEYLSSLLGSAKGVNSGQYREPTMKGEWLQLENSKPLSETKEERKNEKVNAIKEAISTFPRGVKVYAETSSMFIKNFWDVVIEDDDFNVDVIALRRFLPETILRMIALGVGEKIQEDEYNTTFSVNSLYSPPSYFPLNAWDRMMRYAIDIELRTQKFIKDTASKPNVRVTEINLQDINTTKGAENMFIKLGLAQTPETKKVAGVPLPVQRVFKTPSEVRKYGLCSRTMPLTEAKGRTFSFLIKSLPGFIPTLPQMRAPTTYLNRPHNIVGTVFVTKANAKSESTTYAHIANKLQFAELALVAPVGTSAMELVKPISSEYIRVMDSQNIVMKGGSLSYLNALIERFDKEVLPTHIVCYDTKEGLTDSFKSGALFQQLVLSLEPGEALYVAEPNVEGKKVKHKLAAFALANRLVEFTKLNQELNIEDLPFKYKYLLEEGVRMIDWYPTYNIVPIESTDFL